MEITAFFTNNGVPLVAPGTAPTIRIRRIDTQALVVTDDSMTEIGDGNYSYDFTPDVTLDYTTRADGDPAAAGQVKKQERYVAGSFSGTIDQEIGLIEDIHGQVRRCIYIDTSAALNGNGYQQTPYDNFTDAVDDAEANGITCLVLLEDATVDRQLRNFEFEGIGNPTLDVNGEDINRSQFKNLRLDGAMVAANGITAFNCELLGGSSGYNGRFFTCGLDGAITFANSADVIMIDCWSSIGGLTRPSVTLGTGGSDISIRSYRGGLDFGGATNVADAVTVSLAQGKLTLLASNTAGDISVRGVAQFTDNSAGSTVDDSGLLQPIRVSDVWQNEGLDPDNPKTITEITEGADYDEDVDAIHKDVTRVGAVTTLDRT